MTEHRTCGACGLPLPAEFPAGQPAWTKGYLAAKPIDAGEWLIVMPLTFGRARLNVCEPGPAGNASLEHWCLDSPAEAIAAWLAWPDTPTRWNRHQRRDGVLEWPDGRTEPPQIDVYQPVVGNDGLIGVYQPVVGNDGASSSREISEISEAGDA